MEAPVGVERDGNVYAQAYPQGVEDLSHHLFCCVVVKEPFYKCVINVISILFGYHFEIT